MKNENAKAIFAAITAVLAVASSAVTVELEWKFKDGRVQTEKRELVENGDSSVFTLPKAEILGKGAETVSITPDFATARKGDSGFWIFSSGEYGTFRCDDGMAMRPLAVDEHVRHADAGTHVRGNRAQVEILFRHQGDCETRRLSYELRAPEGNDEPSLRGFRN